MALTTTEDALPYPEDTDLTDVPGDIQALAEAIDGEYMLPDGSRRLIATTADVTYYLDSASGDDANDGLSSGAAKASWGAIQSLIPRVIAHNVTVRIIGDYTGNISADPAIVDAGKALTVRGDTATPANHVISGSVQLQCLGGKGNSTGTLQGVVLQYVRVSSQITLSGTGNIVTDCEPRNPGDTGVLVFGQAAVLNCNFGSSVVQDAITSRDMAQVFSQTNSGTATRYGLYALRGAVIAKSSAVQPTGSTANEFTASGGAIR